MNEFMKIATLAVVALVVTAFVVFFNRAPERAIPENGIVSPASGKVIEVRESSGADIVFQKEGVTNHVTVPEIVGPVKVILIQMSPKDVHVQRAPIDGNIIRMDHYDGAHANALGKDKLSLVEENEKVVTIFNNELDTIGVVQVAGRAARRIRNKLDVGDKVVAGDIYGRILLGTQMVGIISQGSEILVVFGKKVVVWETFDVTLKN